MGLRWYHALELARGQVTEGLFDVRPRLGQPEIGRQHANAVPGFPQRPHRALAHQLVAAEVVRRTHVAHAQDAHGRRGYGAGPLTYAPPP